MFNPKQKNHQIEENLRFLVPGIIDIVPDEITLACIAFVSKKLPEHPNTMLQFTSDQILESINKGRVVIAMENHKIVGFGQLWQYGFNKNGQQILEFGSWLSSKSGCGAVILKKAIYLGRKINPTAQIIAITEKENLKAQDILEKAGAKKIGRKFSPIIRTVENEAALMEVFDITECI